MGFKNIIREYFTFNRRERNGVFVLLAIILVLVFYLSFSNLFFTKEKIDFSKFENEILAFEAEQKRLTDSVSESREELAFSGNILYEDSGRTESHYRKNKYPEYPKSNFKHESVLIEINSGDTTELKKIRGIGSVFAKRIVKFREALGGFVKKEQLQEVYGFDKEKFDQVISQVTLNASLVKKININTASVDDLNKHPYISKKEAVAIFTKRVKAGDYTDLQELKKIDLIHEDLFAKLVPYLTTK